MVSEPNRRHANLFSLNGDPSSISSGNEPHVMKLAIKVTDERVGSETQTIYGMVLKPATGTSV